MVDYAHNEAGVAGLVETCRGLRQPGREIWLAMCRPGPPASIRRNMAYLAARGSEHFVVAQLLGYLRGNTPEGVLDGLRAGAADAGHPDVPVHPDEVSALRWMLDSARRGDVVAVTALAQRVEIFDLIRDQGGRPIGPNRVRTSSAGPRASGNGAPEHSGNRGAGPYSYNLTKASPRSGAGASEAPAPDLTSGFMPAGAAPRR